MPRFEHAGKFWSIEQKTKQLVTTFGKLGSPGQTRLKTFPTKNEARAGYLLAVHAKQKEGYVEVGAARAAPAAGPRNAALEAAIDADPYDVDAYGVYADFLQDAGDPRGELIALQLRNKHAAAQKLLAKQKAYFLGPLAAHEKTYDHRYGKRDKMERDDAFVWKYGFIHALRLSHNIYGEQASDGKYKLEGNLAGVLKEILAHPSGRFVAEIEFTFNGEPSGSLQDLIDVLAKTERPAIRKLHFGKYNFAGGHAAGMHGHDTEISWYSVGNLGKLWKKVPGLTHLITQGGAAGHALGGGMQLGTIELPNLVHAEFRTGGMAKANAKAIAKATMPKIEHLEIWYGRANYGGDATVKDAQLLLDRTDLPALRHLGLRNATFTDELVERLVKSKLLEQLTSLDLSMGCMTDMGAKAILKHHKAFAHLATLDISHNFVDDPKPLWTAFGGKKRFHNRGQRTTDYDSHYPAVGE